MSTVDLYKKTKVDDLLGNATSGAAALVPTAVKTGAYTAAVGDLIPVDTTSGAVTITLPAAPADKAQVGVKHVIQGSTNAVTIARGGSDVFNKTGGSTSVTLSTVNQGMVLQYKASAAIWYVVGDSLSLAALDARFPVTAGTTAGQIAVWDGSKYAPSTPTAAVKADVGLGNVDNTADSSKPVSTAQAAAIALKDDSLVYIDYAAAATTVAAYMHRRHLRCPDASTVITIPADTTVIPVGFTCDFEWYSGASVNLTFTPAGGVSLRSRGAAYKIAGLWGVATLRKVGANEWLLAGDLTV